MRRNMDKHDNTLKDQLSALLDLDTAATASPALRQRIASIVSTAQAPQVIIFWSLRKFASFTALYALLAFTGTWAGTDLVARSQEWLDAALIDTVLGPTT